MRTRLAPGNDRAARASILPPRNSSRCRCARGRDAGSRRRSNRLLVDFELHRRREQQNSEQDYRGQHVEETEMRCAAPGPQSSEPFHFEPAHSEPSPTEPAHPILSIFQTRLPLPYLPVRYAPAALRSAERTCRPFSGSPNSRLSSRPVSDFSHAAISSGGPDATTRPPSSPPPGPRSMT